MQDGFCWINPLHWTLWVSSIQMVKSRDLADYWNIGHFGPGAGFFSTPFEYWTIWHLDINLPFEYRTCLVFRCLLYLLPWPTTVFPNFFALKHLAELHHALEVYFHSFIFYLLEKWSEVFKNRTKWSSFEMSFSKRDWYWDAIVFQIVDMKMFLLLQT